MSEPTLGAFDDTFTWSAEVLAAQGRRVERVLLAGRVFWFYLGKLVWPVELIFHYPRWTVDDDQRMEQVQTRRLEAHLAGLGRPLVDAQQDLAAHSEQFKARQIVVGSPDAAADVKRLLAALQPSE